MKQFRDHPKEQLIYLTKFFEKYEKHVALTSRRSGSPEAKKYQQYILLLIKLTCEQKEQVEVEPWVSKPFCPIEPAIKICKQNKNGFGEAILLMR